MIKACLFDLDGVVFNTEPLYTIFWEGVGNEFVPNIPDFAQRIKGTTLVQIFDKYFKGDLETQSKINKKLEDYERNMAYTYVEGFENFIKSLKTKGLKTAVVTSSNLEKMANVYRCHPEMNEYFDKILTSEDFDESKPSPDCYLKAAAYFKVDPTECCVFEDSFNGLKSGKASGAHVIGLSTTNKAEDIAPYCELVIGNYLGFTLPID